MTPINSPKIKPAMTAGSPEPPKYGIRCKETDAVMMWATYRKKWNHDESLHRRVLSILQAYSVDPELFWVMYTPAASSSFAFGRETISGSGYPNAVQWTNTFTPLIANCGGLQMSAVNASFSPKGIARHALELACRLGHTIQRRNVCVANASHSQTDYIRNLRDLGFTELSHTITNQNTTNRIHIFAGDLSKLNYEIKV